jgi:flagellar hook-associated protein 1 FlgK
VNTLNNAGTDLAGDNGNAGNIFSQPAQVAGSAAAMSVVMTDPNHIAAAALGAGTGDNTNAIAIANLANQAITAGQTPTDSYSNFVTSLGSTVSQVQTENTAQTASVTQLQTQNDALSSVNLNDEASSMTALERSYQAASQVFAMLNTVMASALNLGDQTAVS